MSEARTYRGVSYERSRLCDVIDTPSSAWVYVVDDDEELVWFMTFQAMQYEIGAGRFNTGEKQNAND